MKYFTYPGRDELKFFSTFHWVVYMAANKCAYDIGDELKEPYAYKWVEDMICDTDEMKDYIGTYCDTIQKEFPRIKREFSRIIQTLSADYQLVYEH